MNGEVVPRGLPVMPAGRGQLHLIVLVEDVAEIAVELWPLAGDEGVLLVPLFGLPANLLQVLGLKLLPQLLQLVLKVDRGGDGRHVLPGLVEEEESVLVTVTGSVDRVRHCAKQ